jgi:hypothetical protein
MAYDAPYHLETIHVPAQRNGSKIKSYEIRHTSEGFFADTDEHWKARKIIDALNKLEEKPK